MTQGQFNLQLYEAVSLAGGSVRISDNATFIYMDGVNFAVNQNQMYANFIKSRQPDAVVKQFISVQLSALRNEAVAQNNIKTWFLQSLSNVFQSQGLHCLHQQNGFAQVYDNAGNSLGTIDTDKAYREFREHPDAYRDAQKNPDSFYAYVETAYSVGLSDIQRKQKELEAEKEIGKRDLLPC